MSFRELVKKHNAQKADRDADYCDAYDFNFSVHMAREDVTRLLEIGVKDGESLRLWKEYFPNAKIVGIDVDKKCMRHEEDRIKVIIGDQGDKKFLQSLVPINIGNFDIIIDDGSHNVRDQWLSFKYLFELLVSGGLYVIEDLHTSYWPRFRGGIGTYNTVQRLLDSMHAKHWKRNPRAKELNVDEPLSYIDKHIRSMRFYDSICFIQKK